MKYFLISDIHGHFTEMKSALDEAGFNSEDTNHQLIILGDLFDRGTENLKVLEYVHDLLVKDKVRLIKGNHDEFFYDLRSIQWNASRNGFDKTLEEFLGRKLVNEDPFKIMDEVFKKQPNLRIVLDSMVDSITIDKFVLLHGGLDFDGYPDNWCNTQRWISVGLNDKDPVTYIFGHWHAYQLNEKFLNHRRNEPFIYKNYIGIDSAVALTKRMFVYIIETENSEGEE